MKAKSMTILIIFFLIMQSFSLHAQAAVTCGDVNNDGVIGIIDALLTAQYYVGLIQTFAYPEAADVDGDGDIDIVDALLIAQYYVGLIDEFPAAAHQDGDVEILQSDLSRDMSPEPGPGELDAVVDGNNQFAFDCYGQIKGDTGNIFFSPVSISFAFGMCFAGANGNTETEIARTMHFTLPENNLHNAFDALELALTTEPENSDPGKGEELKLHIANSTWGQKDYYFVPEFLDILAYYYGAGMNLVDFKTDPDQCRVLINEWVSEKTENRINDLLPPGSISDLARLVLTNAIYFKANWLDPFDEADTRDGDFYLTDGSTVTVSMMNQVIITGYTEAAGEYQAVKLGYQGTRQNSMIIIMPEDGRFGSVENTLSADTFNGIVQGMSGYMVTLAMPKFEYEWESSLKSTLRSLGMVDAFIDDRADFSGINGQRDLIIHDVFHKAFIAVDEIGTEAAAATAIIIGTTSMPPSAAMTINRPFIFAIYNDDTGAILFLGRVMQP
jgi:serpin B